MAVLKRINSRAVHSRACETIPLNQKPPRAVTLWRHACLTTPVVKPSPPQRPSEQTTTPPPHRHSGHHFAQAEGKCPESPPQGGASHRSCGCAVAKRLHGKGGAGEAPGKFFHTLSVSLSGHSGNSPPVPTPDSAGRTRRTTRNSLDYAPRPPGPVRGASLQNIRFIASPAC